jgi:hypothetical protein
MRVLRSIPFLALFAVAACGDDVDDRPVTWSYIHAAIIVPNCATAGCHSSLTKTIGFDFEDKAKALMFFRGDGGPDVAVISPSGRDGVRMPPDQPLPAADIDLIRRWMADGMPDN